MEKYCQMLRKNMDFIAAKLRYEAIQAPPP